jgi:hypothetical protein
MTPGNFVMESIREATKLCFSPSRDTGKSPSVRAKIPLVRGAGEW